MYCWLATVDDHGMPNVSPKEIFCCHGERELLIANIASPQSVQHQGPSERMRELRRCPDPEGFKVKGAAVVVEPGHPRFGELEFPLQQMTRGAFPSIR